MGSGRAPSAAKAGASSAVSQAAARASGCAICEPKDAAAMAIRPIALVFAVRRPTAAGPTAPQPNGAVPRARLPTDVPKDGAPTIVDLGTAVPASGPLNAAAPKDVPNAPL